MTIHGLSVNQQSAEANQDLWVQWFLTCLAQVDWVVLDYLSCFEDFYLKNFPACWARADFVV